ncbi:MAG: hypothetical protein ACOX3S_10745 [Anaerolineae bacterium]|jgi:hypothetical protein
MRPITKQGIADGTFIILAILGVALWIAALIPGCPQWLQAIVSGPSILAAFSQYAIHHWDWAYLVWQRFLMFVRRDQVNWSLSVTMQTEHQDSVDAATQYMLRAFQGSRIWSDDRKQKIVELHRAGQVARIRLRDTVSDYDQITRELEIRLSNANMNLGSAQKQFEVVNSLLSSLLGKTLAATEQRFAFEILFTNGNPYFGFWVKRLQIPQDALISFQCNFKEHVGPEEGIVQVSAKKLDITTEDLGAWFTLARKYVALSGIKPTGELSVDALA